MLNLDQFGLEPRQLFRVPFVGRYGVGVIVVPENVSDYSKWQFEVDPESNQPDPAKLDEFLEKQLGSENKRRLRKAVK